MSDEHLLRSVVEDAHLETVVVVRSLHAETITQVRRHASTVVRLINADPDFDWEEMISVLILDGHANRFTEFRKAFIQCQPWLVPGATLVLGDRRDTEANEFAGMLIDFDFGQLTGESERFLAVRLTNPAVGTV